MSLLPPGYIVSGRVAIYRRQRELQERPARRGANVAVKYIFGNPLRYLIYLASFD
jgi:hypothetical protein